MRESCAEQLLRRFAGAPLLGLTWRPAAAVEHFGAASGRWEAKGGLLQVLQIAGVPHFE